MFVRFRFVAHEQVTCQLFPVERRHVNQGGTQIGEPAVEAGDIGDDFDSVARSQHNYTHDVFACTDPRAQLLDCGRVKGERIEHAHRSGAV